MPQPADRRIAFLALAVLAAPAAAGESAPDYSTDLSRVYWGYHQVVAQKEVCDSAVPASRAANDRAFAAWQEQHQALAQELRRRVTAMIRSASTDEKDYARNLGKYEGALLQEREEYKNGLLKLPAEELTKQCQGMAQVLRGPDANLAKVYADELAAIRKRK